MVNDVEKRQKMEKNYKHMKVRLESEQNEGQVEKHQLYRVCKRNMRREKVVGKTNKCTND